MAYGKGRSLLASAALTTGVLLVMEGCSGVAQADTPAPAQQAQHALTTTVLTAAIVQVPTPVEGPEAPTMSHENPMVLASLRAKAQAKPVVRFAKAKTSCIKKVRHRVGNGKGASYVEETIDTCKPRVAT